MDISLVGILVTICLALLSGIIWLVTKITKLETKVETMNSTFEVLQNTALAGLLDKKKK